MKIIKSFIVAISLSLAVTAFAAAERVDHAQREKQELKQSETQHRNETSTAKINLNKADASKIAGVVKGIGQKRAEAIVAYRDKNGPFKGFDDLTHVRGIGDRFIQKNIELLKEKFDLG